MLRVIGKLSQFLHQIEGQISPGVSLRVHDFNMVTKIESGLTQDPQISYSAGIQFETKNG